MDESTPLTQLVCIGIAALFSYRAYKKKRILLTAKAEPEIPGEPAGFGKELPDSCVYKQNPCHYIIYDPHHPPGRSYYDYRRVFWKTARIFILLTIVFFFLSPPACIGMAIAGGIIMWKWPYSRDPLNFKVWIDDQNTGWINPNFEYREVPTATFKMMVQVPHRKAGVESHQHAILLQQEMMEREDALRREAQQNADYERRIQAGEVERNRIVRPHTYIPAPTNADPVYKVASELLILSGYGDGVVQAMAEFSHDAEGLKANGLAQTISYVREQCLKEARLIAEKQGMAGVQADTAQPRPLHIPPPAAVEPFE